MHSFVKKNLNKTDVFSLKNKIFLVENYTVIKSRSYLITDLPYSVKGIDPDATHKIIYDTLFSDSRTVGSDSNNLDLGFNHFLKKFHSTDRQSILTNEFSPSAFFSAYPCFGISVNPNVYTLKQSSQRTISILETLIADVSPKKFGFYQVNITYGNILDRNKAFRDTKQFEPDLWTARVLENGRMIDYYFDVKAVGTDKILNYLKYAHPSQLVYCRIFYVGGIKENFFFDTCSKANLLATCKVSLNNVKNEYPTLYNQIKNESAYAVSEFDRFPTIANFNKIPLNIPKILTVSGLKEFFNL